VVITMAVDMVTVAIVADQAMPIVHQWLSHLGQSSSRHLCMPLLASALVAVTLVMGLAMVLDTDTVRRTVQASAIRAQASGSTTVGNCMMTTSLC